MECENTVFNRDMIFFFYNFKFVFRCQSVQNLGLAVVSILSGIIVGKGDNEGYAELEFFFIIWLIGKYFIYF